MVQGVSTVKFAECVQVFLSSRYENTPIHSIRSASTTQLAKKLLSPVREVILSVLKYPVLD
jgi:hypothetical protein